LGRNIKPGLLITTIVIASLVLYLVVNYKEVKQNFVNGVNDGRAQKAKEDSAAKK